MQGVLPQCLLPPASCLLPSRAPPNLSRAFLNKLDCFKDGAGQEGALEEGVALSQLSHLAPW